MSRDPGHQLLTLGVDEVTGLIDLYGHAIEELDHLGDRELTPLLREFLALRAMMLGALSQLGPSLVN